MGARELEGWFILLFYIKDMGGAAHCEIDEGKRQIYKTKRPCDLVAPSVLILCTILWKPNLSGDILQI